MPAPEEWHVASLIVHVTPSRITNVRERIADHPGAEIHAQAPGKLIVVLEASCEAELADGMTALGRLDDVMAATMVFHQVENTQVENTGPTENRETAQETTPC